MRQIARFALVGCLNTATDLIAFNALALAVDPVGWRFAALKATSFLLACGQSYLLNRGWVFADGVEPRRRSAAEAGSFLAVSIAGLVVNVGVAFAAFALLSATPALAALPPALLENAGALAGTAASMGWNFIGYRFFVFAAA